MSSLNFTIRFHSPFRVGGAYGADGAQQSIDLHDALPADSLKGVMRAAAIDLLGERHDLVAQVFGTHAGASPWAWQAAQPTGAWITSVRHRVAIDQLTHSAITDLLVQGEQVWAEQAHFTIDRVRFVPAEDIDRHHSLLRVCAGHVHGLGAWRRRGLGWVQIIPSPDPITPVDVKRLLSERITASPMSTSGEL